MANFEPVKNTYPEDGAVSIARRAAAATFETLTPDEVMMSKKAILDTLGVIMAASTLGNRSDDFIYMAQEAGGKEEATILGWGGKYPALHAAAANGGMAHTLDFDDTIPSTGHQSAGTLPALLAAAEHMGGASGKDFITAFACGADMVCRLHLACPTSTAKGWVGTATTQIFGAAVGAAKMMGLDEKGITNAIGWALWQASFAGQCMDETGSDAREVYCAFSQSYGYLSALLAERGMTSTVNSLEGPDGFFNKYYYPIGCEVEPKYVHVNEGDAFEGVNGSFKPWCACGQTHSYIQATKEIVAENKFTAGDVERIDIKVGELGRRLSENYESRIVPKTGNDAKFSIPYAIACMLVDGNVGLGCFLPENLDKHYDITKKVHWVFDEATANDPNAKGLEPAWVRITLKDGRSFEKTVSVAYGHPLNPLTLDDIKEKFRDCCKYSRKPLSAEEVENVIDMVMNMENMDNIQPIIDALS